MVSLVGDPSPSVKPRGAGPPAGRGRRPRSRGRGGVVADRAEPGGARDQREEERDGDRFGEAGSVELPEERQRRDGGHHRERDDEGEDAPEEADEDVHRPPG